MGMTDPSNLSLVKEQELSTPLTSRPPTSTYTDLRFVRWNQCVDLLRNRERGCRSDGCLLSVSVKWSRTYDS